MAARRTRTQPAEFQDLRSSTFRVGGQRMLVISYAVDEQEPENLSKSEAAVARLAASGHSNADIARARGTSTRTVANQMASILSKLGLSSRRELAVLYHGAGRLTRRRGD